MAAGESREKCQSDNSPDDVALKDLKTNQNGWNVKHCLHLQTKFLLI